jgi:hypothetical protein
MPALMFHENANEHRHGLGRRLVGDAEEQVQLAVAPVFEREVPRQDLALFAHEAVRDLAQNLVEHLTQIGRILQLLPDRLIREIVRRLVGARHADIVPFRPGRSYPRKKKAKGTTAKSKKKKS